MPLPQERRSWGSSSGRTPYFEGPKIALCVPMRKTAASSSGRARSQSAAAANSMMATSAAFTPVMTAGLLKRSAIQPPSIEKSMNGAAKSAPTSATRPCRSSSDIGRAITRRTTRFFSALSLKAFWNWVAMRHQKPRRQPGTPVSGGVRMRHPILGGTG